MKTLTFNRDNWSGEDGSVTYDPDKPLHFKVDTLPDTQFRLELKSWGDVDDDILEILGERYAIYDDDCEHPLGHVNISTNWRDKSREDVTGTSVGIERDDYNVPTNTRTERLLVVAARLIFNTV